MHEYNINIRSTLERCLTQVVKYLVGSSKTTTLDLPTKAMAYIKAL
jgi:hypothetical protein